MRRQSIVKLLALFGPEVLKFTKVNHGGMVLRSEPWFYLSVIADFE
jgi:hypothetical protein